MQPLYCGRYCSIVFAINLNLVGDRLIYSIRTYTGKLSNPVSRRYLCVKNNDLLYKPGL
ncbi:MAG: hypothetical protein MGG11_23105 [Trichodesmium sp. MAG_R03]|nr:hypothetical protein [Trichodesmium sp. MAG_R03]